jgi:oligopeptide/dipeptide ABC transporter ATP-binding protein
MEMENPLSFNPLQAGHEKPFLSLIDLRTYFFSKLGTVRAVDGVSYSISKGEIVGVVGESGSGKSVSALSILRLIPSPPGKIVGGRIELEGRDLLSLSKSEMRKIRGSRISMIFQEPMTSLNPVFTIGEQISEALRLHRGLSKKGAFEQSVEMLRLVGIPSPEKRVYSYPHELSGGMRQRAMIGMALSCHPDLLISDEPTTALDVTIQDQILELMMELKKSLGMAILLITHSLGIVAETAEKIVVMYAGKVMEEASTMQLFDNPLHPYTQGLQKSIPQLGQKFTAQGKKLWEIPGFVPDLRSIPQGCRFHPRCDRGQPICLHGEPQMVEVEPGHYVRCFLAG